MDIQFEKAILMMAEHVPVTQVGSKKPVLFHDIRVGVYLYERNYSRDIVLAGVLHDALEFSQISPSMISDEFGAEVLRLVKACTKDRTIKDPDERIEELASRCAAAGKEALIIKAADTLDSFKHYSKTKNQTEIEYCRKNTQAIFKYIPMDFQEDVFGELEEWLKRYP